MMIYTLNESVSAELVVRKSRFIATVGPASDRAHAREQVQALRAEHPNANHVCWALLAGGESAADDDGEPSGTAARPMLDVLRLQNLDGVAATVVRYFGGIKLGAAGLTRAYAGAVSGALKLAGKIPRVRYQTIRVAAPYELEGRLRRLLAMPGIGIAGVEHGSLVEFTVNAPSDSVAELLQVWQEACHGRLVRLTAD